MGKTRKSGKRKAFGAGKTIAERIRKPNPFDMIFKKSKAKIGGTTTKAVLPARRRALEVRKNTIGVEYANYGKTNKIVDNRLGEREAGLSATEKAQRRFILQRKKQFSGKKTRFNLTDKRDNDMDEDELDEDDDFFPKTENGEFSTRKRIERDVGEEGELDADLVALANFGGGKFDQQKRMENGPPMKRQDVIAQIISESRKAKAIRQMERDTQADNTDRLNELFERLKHEGALQIASRQRDQAANAPPAADTSATQPAGSDAAGGAPASAENSAESIAHKAPAFKEAKDAAPPTKPMINGTKTETTTHQQLRTYDSLYKELTFDDSGRKAPAIATRNFDELGAPSEFDALVTQFEDALRADVTPAGLERVAEFVERIQRHMELRPIPCAERLLDAVVAQRTRHVNASRTNAEFGGVDFASAELVRAIGRVADTTARFHPLATPTIVFATEALTRGRVRGAQHALQLLCLCDTLADWVGASKRYIPEAMAFLQGCLMLCVDNSENEKFPSLSFPITSPFRRMFHIQTKSNGVQPPEISRASIFGHHAPIPQRRQRSTATAEKSVAQSAGSSSSVVKTRAQTRLAVVGRRKGVAAADGEESSSSPVPPSPSSAHPSGSSSCEENDDVPTKLAVIRSLLAVVRRFAELYASHIVSYYAVFGPILALLKRLPVGNFPPTLATDASGLIDFVETKLEEAPQLTHLKLSASNVIRPIEMLEPRFDEHFNPERSAFGAGNGAGDVAGNAARKARKREQTMRQRARKEMRGAMKELRRDAKFIAKIQSDEAKKVSKERREKTNRILASLQTQESEYKQRKLKKY